VLPSNSILTASFVKNAVQLVSQSWPIKSIASRRLAKSGKTWAMQAAGGFGRSS
jgi:hypothetical protein